MDSLPAQEIAWKLVFVVPKEKEDVYQAGKTATVKGRKVERFVLGVDIEAIWEAKRSGSLSDNKSSV